MPYSEAAKEAARRYVAERRAQTFCVGCSAQPIDWHSDTHLEHPNFRVARLTAKGYPIARIEAEIAICTALCRRCHMTEDGRLIQLKKDQPRQPGDSDEPKPCGRCGEPTKPLRKGKCRRCYDGLRRGHLV